MSTTIDQKVVEMRFDNKNFESNVQTSMSTIDKLKQKLNFDGASKGLENLNTSVKKVDMSGLSNGVETVRARFSALEVMAVTALANITNSAINAGKQLISSLTIEPISQGYKEYELKMDSVQTIMASTGESLETVNGYLQELNTYADKTIYSFSDMTSSIGKFTNAGVNLEDAVKAIQGISNEAAVSGANAQQASHAMYNFAQALSSGAVKLQDWKSIENAQMATVEFKNELIKTAVELGTLVESGGEYISTTTDMQGKVSDAFTATKYFNESLSAQWMTTDVLVTTLGKYSDETSELGKKAFAAAQDVKTFSQLLDTLKEAVGSGWSTTFELLIGDFNQAKELLTSISNTVGGFIDGISDARNDLLRGSLSSSWDQLTYKLQEAGVSTDEFTAKLKETAAESGITAEKFEQIIEKEGSLANAFKHGSLSTDLIVTTLKKFAGFSSEVTDSTEEMTDKMEKYGEIVDKVIRGDFGNGAERVKALTEAGYDYATIQNLVNEKLGCSVRLLSTLDEEQLKNADSLSKMSDEQLESMGYTEDQIKALRELAEAADQAGTPINKLIEDLSSDKLSGRELLIETFKNTLGSLVKVIQSVTEAWRDIFPATTSEQLYGIIDAIHTFSTYLIPTEETLDKITRTFKGLFAVLDIIKTVIVEVAKTAFGLLSSVVGAVDIDILGFTASVGDMLVEFRDWIKENDIVIAAVKKLAEIIKSGIELVKKWVNAFLELPAVKENIEKVVSVFDKAKESVLNFINGIKDGSIILDDIIGKFAEIGKNIVDGLLKGLTNGEGSIFDIVLQLGKNIIEILKNILRIHSPSEETYEIGTNTIDGLFNGLSEGLSKIWDVATKIGTTIIDALKSINWGAVVAVVASAGIFVILNKISDALLNFSKPFESVGKVLDSVSEEITNFGNAVNQLSKYIKAKALEVKAKALKQMATSLLMMVAAVAVLTYLDTGKTWAAIGAIAALSAIMAGLSVVVNKFGSSDAFNINFAKFAIAVKKIAMSLVILAAALKIVSTIKSENMSNAIMGLTAIVIALATIMTAVIGLAKIDTSNDIEKIGPLLLKVSAAFLIMTQVLKQISKLEYEDIAKGILVITDFTIIITALIYISKFSGEVDNVGTTLLQISAAMLIMVGIIKLLAAMDPEDLTIGLLSISAFGLVVSELILVSKLGGKDTAKIGSNLLAISGAILILVGVVALLSIMEPEDIVKGLGCISLFGLVVGELILISRISGSETNKVGIGILAISGAVAILAAVAILLSLIDLAGLAKGIVAVGLLSSFVALMIVATRGAENCKGNLIVITVAIGLLAGAVAALSFIETEKLATATLALSMLMGMFALIVKMSDSVKASVVTLAVMTVVVAALGGILYLLQDLPVESTLAVAASLSVLLLSLSAALLIVSQVGDYCIIGVVSASLMVLVLGQIALVIALMSKFDVEPSIETAGALSILLLSLSAACVILTGVGLVASSAFIGIGVLATLITAVGGLIIGIGALATYFPQMEEFLDKGIPILEKIGYALGSFLGNIIGGLSAGITAGLPDIGLHLSVFMASLEPFIEGAKTVDDSVLDGVKTICAAILAITGTNVLNSISSWITGGSSSISSFATELSTLGAGLKSFVENIGTFDEGTVTTVTCAANSIKALAEAADALPNQGGWIAKIVGENDIATFGGQLVSLGVNLNAFVSNLGTFDEDKVNTVTCAANAIKILAEAADTLPSEGGWIAKIVGDNNIATFGGYLPGLAVNLNAFATNLGTFDEDKVSTVECAANAIKVLANAAESLPNEGGWLAAIVGDNSISTFGSYLGDLGTNLNSFVTNLGTFDQDKLSTVKCAANAVKVLAEAAEALPDQGGWLSKIVGDQSFSTFGSQLGDLGTNISSFATNLGTFNKDKVSTVNCAVEAINAISTLADVNLAKATKSMSGFGEELVSFAGQVSDFVSKLGETSTITTAVDNLNKIVSAISEISSSDSDALNEFGKSLNTIGKKGVDEFTKAFTSKTAISGVKKAITDLISSAIKAIEAKLSDFTDAFSTLLDSSVSTIEDEYQSFYDAGSYLVDGVANAITENTYKVTAQAKAMMKAAKKAAEEEAGIESPSKEFYEIGNYLVQGLANGIGDNTYDVEFQTKKMSELVINTARNTLGVHSDSTEFFDIATNVVGGFISGLKDRSFSIEETVDNVFGTSVIDKAKEVLGIKSDGTSEVASDKIGKSVSKGVAKGIKKDKSPEEAAEEKAQAIIDTFTTKLESLDAKQKVAELEYDLWKATDTDATDEEKQDKQNELIEKKIELQKKRIEYATSEYEQMLKTLGEYNKHTQEAYADLLQDKIDLIELQKELVVELPTKVMANELGGYIVQGIANGITEDMSAEEAAKQKVQNIMDAFDEELKGLDLDDEAANLNYKLWMAENGAIASDAEKEYMRRLNVEERIANQQQRIVMLEERSEAILKEVGIHANEYIEACNELTQAKIDLNDLVIELNEILPPKLVTNDLGEYIVEGIVYGITSDMTAEEAAEQKAQNIMTAFQEEFDRLSREQETADLEYKLWQALNGDTSDAEKEERKMSYLQDKINRQAERVRAANAEYESLLSTVGRYNEQTEVAYQDLLDEKCKLIELEEEIQTDLPAKVMKNDIGQYIVQGIAHGITSDMSAEEAAQQKAQNIVDAFKEELDKLDLDKETSDLELQAWEALNPDASAYDTRIKKLSTLTDQIATQTEAFSTSYAEYLATLQQFGEDAEETQTAYNKYLTEQIELADLINEYNETNAEALEKYNAYIEENQEKMLELGYTMDEIRQAAMDESGYDPNDITNGMTIDAKQAVTDAMNAVKVAFEETSGETFKTLIDDSVGVGNDMGDAVGEGIEEKAPEVADDVANMSTDCIATLRDEQPRWKDCGIYLVRGFIQGIKDTVVEAANEAAAMAQAAYDAAMSALGIASPSKKFAKLGMYVDLGFVKGIQKYANRVSNASEEMALDALSNLNSIVSRIYDIINLNLDTEPTIRPVIDLSDVKTGVRSINSMLALGSSPRILSNVGAISYAMNQNGETSEIVSAIDKLRKDLGNVGNTSYIIDGITYDDGSNISDAVKTIVRAAKIGGRV